MQPTQSRDPSLLHIFGYAALLVFVLFAGLVAFALTTATASGTASLPGGATLDINAKWGFFVAANKPNETCVSIAGSELVFGKGALSIDGINVPEYDGAAQQVALVADRRGLVLVTDGEELRLR